MVSLLNPLLRLTARTSFLLFILAYAGPALAVLSRSALAQRLRAVREHFVLAFALSHTIHLVLVITLAITMGWSAFLQRFTWVTVIVGGFSFALIYALAADAAARLRLRTFPALKDGFVSFAMYFLWAIFALAFLPRISLRDPVHTIFGLAAIAGLVLRVAGRRRGPSKVAAAARP